MVYKNTEDLSGVHFDSSNPEFLTNDIPQGSWKKWSFHWNHSFKDMNIKLGDCVYVKQIKGNNWDMLRVQYLITDGNGKPWFCGYHLFSIHQVPAQSRGGINNQHKIYFPNQKLTVPGNGWAPLTAIVGVCCCLYLKDYKAGRPIGFKKSDTYPIIYNYNWDKTLTAQQKKLAVTQISQADYKACKNPLVWRDHTVEEQANLTTDDRIAEAVDTTDDEGGKSKKRKSKAKTPKSASAKKPRPSRAKVQPVRAASSPVEVTIDEEKNGFNGDSNGDEHLVEPSTAKPTVPYVKPGPKSKKNLTGPKPGPKSKTKPKLNAFVGNLFDNDELSTPKIGVDHELGSADDYCSF